MVETDGGLLGTIHEGCGMNMKIIGGELVLVIFCDAVASYLPFVGVTSSFYSVFSVTNKVGAN